MDSKFIYTSLQLEPIQKNEKVFKASDYRFVQVIKNLVIHNDLANSWAVIQSKKVISNILYTQLISIICIKFVWFGLFWFVVLTKTWFLLNFPWQEKKNVIPMIRSEWVQLLLYNIP